MKRLHIHLAVRDLPESIRFYTTLFGAEPTVSQPDYAKWQLDDPRVNFAISQRGSEPGLDHLGIQVESAAELEEISQRLADAALPAVPQPQATCCYAQSDKHWTIDPQGIAWESFLTLSSIPVYGEAIANPMHGKSACCQPEQGDPAS